MSNKLRWLPVLCALALCGADHVPQWFVLGVRKSELTAAKADVLRAGLKRAQHPTPTAWTCADPLTGARTCFITNSSVQCWILFKNADHMIGGSIGKQAAREYPTFAQWNIFETVSSNRIAAFFADLGLPSAHWDWTDNIDATMSAWGVEFRGEPE